jgi:ribosomal peptide maturation radical SAM protein 1
MRIVLVTMPWAAIEKPSLTLGILRQTLLKEVTGAEVTTVFGNLDYVDWLLDRRHFTFADYDYYAVESYFFGCGDWIFSSALYDDPGWRIDEFRKHMSARTDDERIAQAIELHQAAPEFIRSLAKQVSSLNPDVVGFTSAFQQNTASLATARELKTLCPGVVTIFGGANCDGEQGAAMHRNFPFVDFVVRGEGEVSLPAFIRQLNGDHQYAAIPGLCWRATDGASVVNAMPRSPLPPAAMVAPVFDEFFERFAVSKARNWAEPRLILESARGCWWGEKHHCTFCGLNGSSMQFRSKSPETFVTELLDAVERYKILEIAIVDNILDMSYLGSVLPEIAKAGYDLRMHYEIKANMKRDQLRVLLAAGVVHVQPGIESLSSRVLKLMDKGVTGCQNVRLLRDAESLGMQAAWNYLFGFPGEDAEDYHWVIAQFPALHHLIPPESAGDITVERFSPYFDRPDLGFGDLSVTESHRITYDLPERELYDLSYYFAAPERGIDDAVVRKLRTATARWKDAYYRKSRFTHSDLGEEIILVSTRSDFDWHVHSLADPVEVGLFRLLDQPHTVASLARKLSAAGTAVTEEPVAQVLSQWLTMGIVFAENGQFVQLATAATNQELQRWTSPAKPKSAKPKPARPVAFPSGHFREVGVSSGASGK